MPTEPLDLEPIKALEAKATPQSCYYCGKPTNDLAASPSMWSVALCHEDEPGVVKWHHTGCVSERLAQRDMLRELLVTLFANMRSSKPYADWPTLQVVIVKALEETK